MHRRIDKALAAKLTEEGLGSAPWVPDHGYGTSDYDSNKRARLDMGHDAIGLVLLAVLIKVGYGATNSARLTFEVEDHINLNNLGEPRVKAFESIHHALAHIDDVRTKASDDSAEAERAKIAADTMYGDCYLTLDAIHSALGTSTVKAAKAAADAMARASDPTPYTAAEAEAKMAAIAAVGGLADDDSDPIDVPSGAEVEDDGEDGAPADDKDLIPF